MHLRKDILTSTITVVILTALLGVAYPLLITGVSQVAFPGNANGQQIRVDGRLVGSKSIGQNFAQDPRYFQSRPSGTTPPDNGAASSFANLGPNSIVTERAIADSIRAYIRLNGPYLPHGLSAAQVPVDAADTSASGVDPDISVANATIQAYRIAAVRHVAITTVRRLISRYTAGRGLGFSGEPAVNVLELNLALDRRR